jgi:hypothetical protein
MVSGNAKRREGDGSAYRDARDDMRSFRDRIVHSSMLVDGGRGVAG